MEIVVPTVVAPPAPAFRPKRMEIYGEEKSLESLLEQFAGIWEVSEENLVNYRRVWNTYLPKRSKQNPENILNAEWCMSYNPIVSVRKCIPSSMVIGTSIDELPYFIVILNAARDHRPRQAMKKRALHEKSQTDPLQKNIIDRGMIISEFGDFYFCPNGFPYHHYASLLISKDPTRHQEYPTPHDIETWMRFSLLTKQYVFFNSPHAGASIPGRLHAQVVDPEGIRYEEEKIVYPVLHKKIMKRRAVREGIDILSGYGVEMLALKGRDAPYRAALAVRKLRDEHSHWYNLMVNGKEVLVVGRNAEKETSHCIGKKCGAYEMSGVVLVGNIEEPLLEKLDLDRVVDGAVIFSHLHYEQIASNVSNATVGLGGLENRL